MFLIQMDLPVDFRFPGKRPVPASRILNPEQATMQLEFHQLDRRWEHLRVREPHRQRRLLASLADSGQQTPIVVVTAGPPGRYLLIDGHKRVAALEQLGRDTVEATVWAMSEAEALLLSRSLRFGPPESALEQGWLLAEMEQRFGYSLDELARRFDRSTSWVSRRLALVELLPEAIQQQVREGKLAAQAAMKYLVPVARVSADGGVDDAAVPQVAILFQEWVTSVERYWVTSGEQRRTQRNGLLTHKPGGTAMR